MTLPLKLYFGLLFPKGDVKLYLKIDATSKGIQPPFTQLLNPLSFEDQSADVLSNKKGSTFWYEKTLLGEFRTQLQGDCNVKLYWPSNTLLLSLSPKAVSLKYINVTHFSLKGLLWKKWMFSDTNDNRCLDCKKNRF